MITPDYAALLACVRSFVGSRVSDQTDADDITSITMLAIVEGLPRYEDRGYPVTAWAFAVARCKIVDYYRRERRRAVLPLCDTHATPGPSTVGVELHEALDVVRALPPRQQGALLLRAAGYGSAEIARGWGITEGAIKSLIHRARQAL